MDLETDLALRRKFPALSSLSHERESASVPRCQKRMLGFSDAGDERAAGWSQGAAGDSCHPGGGGVVHGAGGWSPGESARSAGHPR